MTEPGLEEPTSLIDSIINETQEFTTLLQNYFVKVTETIQGLGTENTRQKSDIESLTQELAMRDQEIQLLKQELVALKRDMNSKHCELEMLHEQIGRLQTAVITQVNSKCMPWRK